MHTTATSGQTLLLNLSAGNDTVDIAYREDGARIDRILVTNVATYVPGGTGG